ncbi:MAG: enoyl-CoA hydratase [Gordonia sp.]|nr:enoyl-CoA hydratase [Gordonia sp. (in: high G+C Gram-positive bacteria)]
MTADNRQVSIRVADGVGTVTLDAPERGNALDGNGFLQLRDALRQASSDDAVRVVVITGSGKNFCTGAALGRDRAHPHPLRSMQYVNGAATALHDLAKPSVARVRGHAIGAGWSIGLGCDLVVADTSAKFSTMFTNRGLSPDLGASWLLPRIVGLQQAKRLSLLGESIDATQALDLGLVTWVVDPDELDAQVFRITSRLAQAPPVAVAQTIALLNEGADCSFAQSLTGEARALAVNLATDDIVEARRAFQTKTSPNFTGGWSAS